MAYAELYFSVLGVGFAGITVGDSPKQAGMVNGVVDDGSIGGFQLGYGRGYRHFCQGCLSFHNLGTA